MVCQLLQKNQVLWPSVLRINYAICDLKPGTFVNLDLLPTELALNILSHLNATDLCLASCVWYNLGCDDVLWQDLCRRNWPFCSFYKKGLPPGSTYRQLYLRLDEARLTFRADAFNYGLLDDNFNDIVEFFHTAPGLDPVQKCRLFHSRPQLLYGLLDMKDFTEYPVPTTDSASFEFITLLVGKFAERFVACNSGLGLSTAI
ncbi:unnamed protein product [Dicrocoelium dendriticum]|nr:unnamed protein product [Dicrocoelium dendriticum]